MLAADVATVLPDDFLVKVDRASMACGLEVRLPLLDHELLELAARIPAEWKVHRGETKWIFKETVRPMLPPGLVDRPKQGFDVPIDTWLRGPLRPMFESAVLHGQGPLRALLDGAAVARLYRRHLSGFTRHGPVLWSLLVLARWAERYL
jgi:asparagine synthase (glutamine-hydrolysing)